MSRTSILLAAVAALCAVLASTLHVAAAPPNYSVVAKIALAGPVRWDYLNADPKTHDLFVSRGSFVSVIDPTAGKEIGQVPNTQGVHGIALLPKLGLGFASDGGAGTVTVFDLKTLAVKTAITVGAGPDGIVADPSTERVISMDARANDLSIIDGKTLTVIGVAQLNGRPEGYEVDGKGHVFTHYEDKSEVAEIDEATHSIVKEWSLAPGDGPSGMAMDRKHGLLFSACHNQTLVVSDVATGKVVATASIDNGPDACAIDQSTGNVFVPCGGDGVIDVIHADSTGKYVTIDRAVTQAGARTIAYDPSTKTLYTCTGSPAPVDPNAAAPAPGERRRPRWADNSFTVLVLKSN
jgi:DNA-binding beta-propeller fold protein YncE